MSQQHNAYDNLYTKKMEEACFDQHGYNKGKQDEKAKIRRENQRYRSIWKGSLVAAGLLSLCGVGYVINLDPDNAGPASIFLAVVLFISGLVWFINK